MQLVLTSLLALAAAQAIWAAPAPVVEASSAELSSTSVSTADLAEKTTDASGHGYPRNKRDIWATLYEHTNFKGGAFSITVKGQCLDVPPAYNDWASSLTITQGTTCNFYSDTRCGGVSISNREVSNASWDLRGQRFNDRITAYYCY